MSATASRTRTISNVGSEDGGAMSSTLLPGAIGAGATTMFGYEPEDLRQLLDRLEAMQADLTAREVHRRVDRKSLSPHQPSQEIDKILAQVIGAKPELRARLAVMTGSALLRKKILSIAPAGGRGVGSTALGSSHPWRHEKVNLSMSDHNWPKVAINPKASHHGSSFLPCGDQRHARLLRNPAERHTIYPDMTHSQNFSFSKAERFPGTHENGELNKAEIQRRSTPGPGAYHRSVPRAVPFSADGENVAYGAQHPCPWKNCLGRGINPVAVDAQSVHISSPKFSFSKARRNASETTVGHQLQDGGPVKSDMGCLSPGHIYEMYSSFRPGIGKKLPTPHKRRSMSTSALPRIRCIPVPALPDDGTGSYIGQVVEPVAATDV